MSAPRPEDVLRIMAEDVPFNRTLGIEGVSAAVGRAVLRLPVRPDHVGDPRRPALHGGVLCHVRVAVTQAGVLVAEGRGVYSIHRRSAP